MTAQLKEYQKQDSGFTQFCAQYSLVASDPQAREYYLDWISNRMRDRGLWEGGYEDGFEEGEQTAHEKWSGIVADKDAAIADKDAAIADKDALIAELRKQLADRA